MANSEFRSLSTADDWNEALEQSENRTVLVFKHSAACPVSGSANQEVQAFAEMDEAPVYRVVVQDSRSVSNEIADALGVQHETPQAILLRDREAVFSTSHFSVSSDTLREELRRVSAA